MNPLIKKTVSALIVFASLFLAAKAAIVTYQEYSTCTSRDVLQWDGNIRLTFVLDRYQDLQDGKIGDFISSYFRGNTWPPLRGFISLIFSLLAPNGPSAVLDTSISFLFYILLFVSLLYILFRAGSDTLVSAALFLFSVSLLIHTRELPAYSVASMLETQGMFFLLWGIYFLYRLYEFDLKECDQGGSAGNLPRYLKYGIFVSLQGLTFTKYPYAVMLYMSLAACEIIRHSSRLRDFLKNAINIHYRGWRRVSALLFVLVGISILAAGKIGYMGLNQKSVKYFIYLISLLVFIDFNLYLRKYSGTLRTEIPLSTRGIYIFGIAPSLTWIFLHPDRFSSILGGQFFPAQFRSSFFETLFLYAFDSRWISILFFSAAIVSFLAFFARDFWKNKSVSLSPASALFLAVWFQFLAQELFSPNKQDRHIYHILPALIFVSGHWLYYSATFSKKPDEATFPKRVILSVLSALFVFASGYLAFDSEGILSGKYASRRPFCFTGKDASIFEPARWAASEIKGNKKYVLMNELLLAEPASNRRILNTEVDLLFRMRALQIGSTVRNDSRYLLKTWESFDHLMVVAGKCEEPVLTEKITRRAAETKSRIVFERTSSHPEDSLCLIEYRLER